MIKTGKNHSKKATILDISKKIARQEGLSQLNIRRIAKESGVSVGSVYNIVGSKDDLVLYLVKDYWEESIKLMGEESKSFDGDYLEKLNQLYLSFMKASKDFHSGWIRDLVGIHMENPHIVELSNFYKKEIEKMIGDILRDDKSISGKFTSDFNPEDLSQFIFNNMMLSMSNASENLGFLTSILKRSL